MAVSKVVYDSNTLIDLTGDTVTPDTLVQGITAHNAAGEPVVGTFSIDLPTETVNISTEGQHDVLNYATANVDIDFFDHIERGHNLSPSEWQRPEEWQPMANDYDSGEQLYMVYDTELLPENSVQFACWYATTSASSTNLKIERGYVDSTGSFNVVSSDVWTRNTSWVEDLPKIGVRYLVYRITPIGTGHITVFCHDRPTSNYNPSVTTTGYYMRICQPMIEAYGSLPYITTMYSSAARGWNAFYEVHHDIKNMTALTNCANMFYSGEKLECIDGLDTWDTSKVTNFSYFFSGCRTLRYIDLSNISVASKCTTLFGMFQNCHQLVEANINIVDTSNVTDFGQMFYLCFNLEIFDASKLISNKVARMDAMFYNCHKIKKIDLSGLSVGTWATAQTLASLFANCYNVQKIDISNLNPVGNKSLASMCQSCSSLREIKFHPNFSTSAVTSMATMFQSCYMLENVDFIKNWNTEKVTSIASMFKYCRRIKQIDMSNFSSTALTTMEATFQDCFMLEELILPNNFVTSKVTTLGSTFLNCYKLKRINTVGWDTQNVTSMNGLFNTCRKLIDYGNIDNWNYDKCTTMAHMFANCSSITSLPNFSNKTFLAATTWIGIFFGCVSVKGDIVMNNVSLPKATTIANAFQGLYKIDSLTTNGWNVPLVTTVSSTFSNLYKCSSLQIKDWNAPKLSTWTNFIYGDYCLRNLDCNLTFTGTSSAGAFTSCFGLENIITFPTIGKVATTINASTLLTADSLVAMFNALPTNSSALKLTIGTANINKLTDAQKAIATNKKWTLA